MRLNPPRDPVTHQLVPNATRFPSGFGGLANYMHAEGVQFAVYTAESPTTCAGYPASKGYEVRAQWRPRVEGCGVAAGVAPT